MNRMVKIIFKAIFALTAVFGLFLSPVARIARAAGPQAKAAVEGEIVAKLDFDPKVNGFGFDNYPPPQRHWQDDLGADLERGHRQAGADARPSHCKSNSAPGQSRRDSKRPIDRTRCEPG